MKKFISKYDNRTFIIDEDLPGVGFYIYAYDTNGNCTHDYLQDNLDMAKHCALNEFGVPVDSWVEIETANTGQRKSYAILDFLPTYGPMYIPVSEKNEGYYSEGFVVRFYKPDGTDWVANFKPGWTNLKEIHELPDSSNLLVIACGTS